MINGYPVVGYKERGDFYCDEFRGRNIVFSVMAFM